MPVPNIPSQSNQPLSRMTTFDIIFPIKIGVTEMPFWYRLIQDSAALDFTGATGAIGRLDLKRTMKESFSI
jgi:hypothetical protein